jgi:hypothetical protein
MKNFTVTPFEEVSKNLSEAARKTVEALDKEKRCFIILRPMKILCKSE